MSEIPYKQDLPPPGGFPSIPFKKNMPAKGPSGAVMFLIGGVVMVGGLFIIGQSNKSRRYWREEKLIARRNIIPMLQAEEDRRFVRALEAAKKDEEELMKNVKGWKMHEKLFNTDKFVALPPFPELGHRH